MKTCVINAEAKLRRYLCIGAMFFVSGCTSSLDLSAPQTQPVFPPPLNYCVVSYGGTLSAGTMVAAGFTSVEQQCGQFFDNLAELSREGSFAHDALEASNLGTQSIMQAAKAAARSVTIVAASYTLTEAVLTSFIKEYAFSPYLYKIRDLTFQAFDMHQKTNQKTIDDMKEATDADSYCRASILIQQHARICTLSYIQTLFDQQVGSKTILSSSSAPGSSDNGSERTAMPHALSLTRATSPTNSWFPAAPNYHVVPAP